MSGFAELSTRRVPWESGITGILHVGEPWIPQNGFNRMPYTRFSQNLTLWLKAWIILDRMKQEMLRNTQYDES